MLFVIGGPPRCGKTTVAQRLTSLRPCSRVPTDYLGTAFTNYIPPTELPTRYPDWQTATVDARYERYTAVDIITNYRTKAATSWPGIRDFLSYALYDQHDMVVEGYHLEPAFVAELVAAHPQFAIHALFLYRTDTAQLQDDLRRSTDPEDWVLRSATTPRTFQRIAAMVADYSTFFVQEARVYGFPVVTMDGVYADRISAATAHLLDSRT
jgi:2-phosphoglycerate kinase